MPIGLYICQCEQVAKTLDVGALASSLSKAKGVAICITHPRLCSADGIAAMQQKIREGAIDRVVIAGCSPRVHGEMFVRALEQAGLNRYLIEFCNLREQCALPHANEPEQATRKAKTLMAMALAKARLLEPLTPLKYPAVNRVLIVGAGIAGLSAAYDLAMAGVETIIVEKQPYVGGKVVGLHQYFPRMCPPQCGMDFIVRRLDTTAGVRIHTQTQVSEVMGSPGNFQVTLQQQPRYVDVARCNSCGECARVCPIERDNAFDFGKSKSKAIYLPYDLAYPPAYVIDRALCPTGCDACQRACPMEAIHLDETSQEVQVNVGSIIVATGWEAYDAARVERYGYGRYANVVTNLEFERLAALNGPTRGNLVRLSDGAPVERIAFIQCVGSRDVEHLPYCSQICCGVTLKQIAYVREKSPDAHITVFYMDMRAIGELETLYRDAQEKHNALFIRGNPFEIVEQGEAKTLLIRAEDTLSARQIEIPADLVVLATGLQPNAELNRFSTELSATTHFANGHVQCFPYDWRRTGIYAAGCAQGPMDVATSIKSAGGAAMKAMATLRQEIPVRPTVPVLDTNKCDKCKRCMEECPFDAWYWDASGYPAPDYLKCRQCGICQGGCPLRVISLKNFSIKQIAAMIQAVNPSFAGQGEPSILAFLCMNDAYPAADLAGEKGYVYPANIVTIPVPCAGSVNVAWVNDALINGIDGVVIAGCATDQCHFFHGSWLAQTRLENMRETLTRMRIEAERVRMINLGITDGKAFAQFVESFVADLRKIGPNPFKV